MKKTITIIKLNANGDKPSLEVHTFKLKIDANEWLRSENVNYHKSDASSGQNIYQTLDGSAVMVFLGSPITVGMMETEENTTLICPRCGHNRGIPDMDEKFGDILCSKCNKYFHWEANTYVTFSTSVEEWNDD